VSVVVMKDRFRWFGHVEKTPRMLIGSSIVIAVKQGDRQDAREDMMH